MSSSAHSNLIRGVRIEFKFTPTVIKLNRFNSKTGQPKVVEEESLNIEATCQGVSVTLPEETLLFCEAKQSWSSQSYWARDRSRTRIYEWLQSFGVGDTNRGDETLGDLEIFEDGDFIGILLASGGSSRSRYVEVEEKIIPDLQKQVDDLLSKIFQHVKTYKTSVFLLTRLS